MTQLATPLPALEEALTMFERFLESQEAILLTTSPEEDRTLSRSTCLARPQRSSSFLSVAR